MSDFGVTNKGFVLKRMDIILKEIHGELTAGFGFDTRLTGTSFLNTLVTTFAGQIADLWEVGQESYYAKYPATAEGVNLDNAVQYGGIRRKPKSKTIYTLHCTGEDGTIVNEGVIVATKTNPAIRLRLSNTFIIERSDFNKCVVAVSVVQENTDYIIGINDEKYSYRSKPGDTEEKIIKGLKSAINNADFSVSADKDRLIISDTVSSRSNLLLLSDNLTTKSVTTLANFETEEYGKITIPQGLIKVFVTNVPGFNQVENIVNPVYGRQRETDVELRQSYLAKSAIRSNTMIESIVGELLNNVPNVVMACGFENDTDKTDDRGLPPHSVEIIVDGGDDKAVAEAIFRKKAGGIQTFGAVKIDVAGNYGDSIPVNFNRPQNVYVWIKVVLHCKKAKLPTNYIDAVTDAIVKYSMGLSAGDDILVQRLDENIYKNIPALTYVDITHARSNDKGANPVGSDYKAGNIITNSREKVRVDATRIEVSVVENS